MPDQNVLRCALAKLTALRSQIANLGPVPSRFVDQYHAALDDLEREGYDLSRFRIAPEAMSPEVIGSRRAGLRSPGVIIQGDDLVADGPDFLVQLDSVLMLFQLTHEAPTIGFNAPVHNA